MTAFNGYYDERRKEIEDLGLKAIREYFKVEPKDLDKDTLKHLHSKAKIAMQFERELNLSRRAVEMNYIRVFRLIAEDKEELKKYIRESLPQYMPKKKK